MSRDSEFALIFDYDGLIVDSEMAAAQAIIDWFASRGLTVRLDEFGQLFGSTSPDIDVEWRKVLRRWIGPDADLDDVNGQLDQVVERAKSAAEILPGVRELLAVVPRAGWRIGLATGCNRDILLDALARLNLANSFDAIVTAADVARGKPAPDIYIETASRLGVQPSRCVVLEDSLFGCQAALDAGMAVVACPSAVTAWCEFPDEVRRVASLLEVSFDALEQALRHPRPKNTA